MTIRWNWMQNGSYSAQNDRQLVAAMWDGGVLQGFRPVPSVTTRSIDVPIGRCVIEGNDTTGQGSYLVVNDATVTVGLAAPPGSLNRLDLIYIRVRDSIAGGPAGDDATIGVVTGTASATPAVPTLPTSALALCTVLVTPTTAVVNDADIAHTVRVYGGLRSPLGTVILFHGPFGRIPNRWRECNGGTLGPVAAFPDYADFIGQPSGNINLPNYIDRVPVGVGGSIAQQVGQLGGAIQEQLTALHVPQMTTGDESDNHIHDALLENVATIYPTTPNPFFSINLLAPPGANGGAWPTQPFPTDGASADHHHTLGTANPTAVSKMQPWIASRYIIRVVP